MPLNKAIVKISFTYLFFFLFSGVCHRLCCNIAFVQALPHIRSHLKGGKTLTWHLLNGYALLVGRNCCLLAYLSIMCSCLKVFVQYGLWANYNVFFIQYFDRFALRSWFSLFGAFNKLKPTYFSGNRKTIRIIRVQRSLCRSIIILIKLNSLVVNVVKIVAAKCHSIVCGEYNLYTLHNNFSVSSASGVPSDTDKITLCTADFRKLLDSRESVKHKRKRPSCGTRKRKKNAAENRLNRELDFDKC